MFCQESVKKALGEKYSVYAPDENCKFSAYVLNSLRFWLANFPNPDIIHWNAGLWDTAILYKEDGCFTDVGQYIENMKKILRELKKTGAKIIFATTTPVSDKKCCLDGPAPPAHKNEDIKKYNKAILEAFADEDIQINDLFTLLYDDRERYLCEDMIHPNDEGKTFIGEAIANAIKRIS